jgi:hypothetical protein
MAAGISDRLWSLEDDCEDRRNGSDATAARTILEGRERGMIRFFYIFSFNAALAKLGIPLSHVKQIHTQAAQEAGRALGYTPQEAALLLVTNLPDNYQRMANPAVAVAWGKARKIDPHRDAMAEAIGSLSWHDDGWLDVLRSRD